MKLPSSINVLGKTISVTRVEMEEDELGEYKQHRYAILINKKSSQEEALRSLLHEAIHAALHISGISMVIPVNDSVDLEEAIVVCLESAFSDSIDIDKLSVK